MIKYIIFAIGLFLLESCSSSRPITKQSKDAALVSFFINELWDEPDCGNKQIIIRQDTTDGATFFYQRITKEKLQRFQILKFNSDDKIQISNYTNIQIKPYTYKIVTGDDMFPFFPLEENECATILLNGIYHFKDFSLINITIESIGGTHYFASYKFILRRDKIKDIQLVHYKANNKKGPKVDLRKKYPMFEVKD